MKRLILNFKHWLIRKLGGYTEQKVESRRLDVHSHQIQPMIIRSEVRINMYLDSRMMFDTVKSKLANQLAQKIVEDGICNIECRDDPKLQQRIYRAEIFLIHPHDAAMGSLTRRKEL